MQTQSLPPKLPNTSNPISLWDLFCLCSIVGIWPRYLEPNLICSTSIPLTIPNLPPQLKGFKILQISDLHLNSQISDRFLDRLVEKIESVQPDLIAFTGDFLCYSKITESDRLQRFLQRLHAPYGCFAILGNHDYASCVSVNDDGDYDIISPPSSSLARAFARLGKKTTLTKKITKEAKNTPLHSELIALLKNTPFQLLHNKNQILDIKGTKLNICGLGEYILGRLNPELAFADYDKNYPGIILMHNPDGIPLISQYPGDLVLSGHTHGGQVNLPWFWKKFTLLEDMNLKKGLHRIGNKWLYINRGIGSILPFRWFSTPEITTITLYDAP